MTDEEIISVLREKAGLLTPVELAELMGELSSYGLTQGTIVTYFFRAFPGTPIGVLMQAGSWHRVSDGLLTDDEFNELLQKYLKVANSAEG